MNMMSMIYTQFVTQFVSLPVSHWHISCFNMQTVQGQLLDNGLHPLVFCGVPWGRIHDSKSEHSSLRHDWHCIPGMILPTEWLNPGCQRRKNGITTSCMDVHGGFPRRVGTMVFRYHVRLQLAMVGLVP